MSVLAFDEVTVTARMGGRKVDVLRDISFALGQGEIIGLVGESGAGKSMIGRVISGLLPDNFAVTAGSVTFEGDNLLALGKAEAPRAAWPQDRLHPAGAVKRAQSGAHHRQPVRRASAASRH